MKSRYLAFIFLYFVFTGCLAGETDIVLTEKSDDGVAHAIDLSINKSNKDKQKTILVKRECPTQQEVEICCPPDMRITDATRFSLLAEKYMEGSNEVRIGRSGYDNTGYEITKNNRIQTVLIHDESNQISVSTIAESSRMPLCGGACISISSLTEWTPSDSVQHSHQQQLQYHYWLLNLHWLLNYHQLQCQQSHQNTFQQEKRRKLEMQYMCNYCNNKFSSKKRLKSHWKEEHNFLSLENSTNNMFHVCDICEKQLSQDSSLKRHQKTHQLTKKYKYPCEFCEKKFNDKTDYTRHVCTHTGERPFKCQLCQKAFIQKVSLRIHTSKIHGVNLENSNTEPPF